MKNKLDWFDDDWKWDVLPTRMLYELLHSFFSVIILPSATNNVKKIFKSTYAVFQSKQEERPPKQTLLFVLLVPLKVLQLTCRYCSGEG